MAKKRQTSGIAIIFGYLSILIRFNKISGIPVNKSAARKPTSFLNLRP